MPKKILIVDDDSAVVSLIKTRLEANHYEVVTATDGEDGLKKLKLYKPDLIISDIMMPKMDGYSFVLEIKKIADFRNIPIIILTVKNTMQDIFIVEGAKEYITKPFDDAVLLKKVEKFLKIESNEKKSSV